MGIVHYFLGLTMSLMYLIAGPPLTAHFLDNPGIQFTPRQGKRDRERGRKHRERQKIGLWISIAYSWHCGMLGVLIISAETKWITVVCWTPSQAGPQSTADGKTGGSGWSQTEGGRLRTGNVLKLMGAECVLKRKERREYLNFKCVWECVHSILSVCVAASVCL